ncbi:MAG: efflux RND transporter periplasmic adaptor subunit [Betaproteobacteria bacterium]|nr:efflux RND transporter periplasmic adaptor subunit [Betaproteobacteria bacterium]
MGVLTMKRVLFLVLILAVGAGLYAYQGGFNLSAKESAGVAEGGAKGGPGKGGPGKGGPGKDGAGKGGGGAAVPVLVAVVEQRSMPVKLDAIGNVEAFSAVAIKARIDGQITEVNFRDGQAVKQGEVLFKIDPGPYAAVLRQAEATAARDRATFERARQQDDRYKELLEKNFVSADGYAQFKTNAETAAAVAAASQAAVENAKVQFEYTTIRSPIEGYAGKILLQRGNIARAADPSPLANLNQVHPIYVTFAVPEARLAEIRSRMGSTLLAVDAIPSDAKDGKRSVGKLVFIDNGVDLTTGTIKLKAQFENKDNVLWPGQFAQVSMRLFDQADALVIPAQAVQTGPNGQFVFVVKSNETVEVRPVTIARTDGDKSIVASGLKKDEQVVTQGQLRLANGSKVAVKS